MPKNKGSHKDPFSSAAKKVSAVAKSLTPRSSKPSKGPGSKSGKKK
jgi:hypothetical protein